MSFNPAEGHRFKPALESVRGIAALTVCLFHAAEINYLGAPIVASSSIARLPLNGHGAVVLFFVLSGYVLRASLSSKITGSQSELSRLFITARMFRLYPVVIATIILIAGVAWGFDGRAVQWETVIRNALLLDTTMNGVFWTLQVEVLGSILVLISFLIEKRFGYWSVVALTLGLLPLSFMGAAAKVGLLYTFLFGYLIAAMPRDTNPSPRLCALAIAVALIAFYGAHALGYVLKQWLLLITAFSAAIVVLLLSRNRYGNLLQWWPERFLGRVSYSFYALHPLSVGLLKRFGVGAAESLALEPWIATLSFLVLAVAITILMAIPMYLFVERPGMRLGRRLAASKPIVTTFA
jgi:peptidoglycan/LPS O-acetylase OafA/YrhL